MTTLLITGCARGLGLATIAHLLTLPPSHPTYPERIFATYRHEPSKELSRLLEAANGSANGYTNGTADNSALSINGVGASGTDGGKGRLVLVRLDDVTSVDDVERARDEIEDVLLGKGERRREGRGLDVLVNNAALMHRNEGGIGDLYVSSSVLSHSSPLSFLLPFSGASMRVVSRLRCSKLGNGNK